MTYTSADFDGQHATDYQLLVRVGAMESALAIVDQERQLKYMATYNAPQEVSDLVALDFGQVKLAIDDSRYIFIPEEVYDETHLEHYVRYLPDDGVRDSVASDIPSIGIQFVHQTSRLHVEPFEERFPQLRLYPAMQALLTGVADQASRTKGTFVAIDVQSPWLHIAAFNSGDFVYGNDFEVYGVDDFNYYLLIVLNQLGKSDAGTTFCLSGDIAVEDNIHRTVKKYGNRVMFANGVAFTGISLDKALLPDQHRFLTLFSLYSCG